jgi:hypothetical protein
MRFLSQEFAHARDTHISFNEDAHQYTVDEAVIIGSVSSLWGAYFERFDAPRTARRCYAKWARAAREGRAAHDADDWTYVAHYVRLIEKGDDAAVDRAGVKRVSDTGGRGYSRLLAHLWRAGLNEDACVAAVVELWGVLGNAASARGTYVHLQCELNCNGEAFDFDAAEVKQYLRFRADNPTLSPFRTEWSVFARAGMYTIAGQVDAVYRDASGEFHMIDYKCCAHALTPANPFERQGIAPFDDVPDTPWGHYAVQQNIYRHILETCYGVTLQSARLLRVHASLDAYELVEIPDLRVNVAILFETLRVQTKTPNHV